MPFPLDGKYEIEKGDIIKYDQPARRLNPVFKAFVDHTVYIYVLKIDSPKSGQRRKDAGHHILMFCVPNAGDKKRGTLCFRKVVQRDSITKQLKIGFERLARAVSFNYTPAAYRRIYKRIGVL